MDWFVSCTPPFCHGGKAQGICMALWTWCLGRPFASGLHLPKFGPHLLGAPIATLIGLLELIPWISWSTTAALIFICQARLWSYPQRRRATCRSGRRSRLWLRHLSISSRRFLARRVRNARARLRLPLQSRRSCWARLSLPRQCHRTNPRRACCRARLWLWWHGHRARLGNRILSLIQHQLWLFGQETNAETSSQLSQGHFGHVDANQFSSSFGVVELDLHWSLAAPNETYPPHRPPKGSVRDHASCCMDQLAPTWLATSWLVGHPHPLAPPLLPLLHYSPAAF